MQDHDVFEPSMHMSSPGMREQWLGTQEEIEVLKNMPLIWVLVSLARHPLTQEPPLSPRRTAWLLTL